MTTENNGYEIRRDALTLALKHIRPKPCTIMDVFELATDLERYLSGDVAAEAAVRKLTDRTITVKVDTK